MATKKPILTQEQKFAKNDRWVNRAAFATSLLSIFCVGVVGMVAAWLAFQCKMIGYALIVLGIGVPMVLIGHVFLMALWSHFIDSKIIRNKLYELESLNNNEELDL